MRWSKLRTLVKHNFADSVRDRVDIQSTRYGACTCGHAWITLDGNVIANFCTRAKSNAQGSEPIGAGKVAGQQKTGHFAGYGEFSRQDAYQACWAFVHDLSIEAGLKDSDPLVQTLAVIDSRVGKRRLKELELTCLHPLAAAMLNVRRQAEGIAPEQL